MSKHACLGLFFKGVDKGLMHTQVLLVLENTSVDDCKDAWRWSLPGGKCCDDKLRGGDCCPETPDKTAVRECKAETGYDISLVQLISSKDKANPETGRKYTRHIFLVKIVGGKPLGKKVFSRETPQWFPIAKLPRNLFFSHRKIIQQAVLSIIT